MNIIQARKRIRQTIGKTGGQLNSGESVLKDVTVGLRGSDVMVTAH